MSEADRLVEFLKNKGDIWISESELLFIVPDKKKLDKEIAALKESGWEIHSRSVRQPVPAGEDSVSLKLITQYLYASPKASNGWTCTRCGAVYTSVSDGQFGTATLDPIHRQAVCWRCKKKTFWRRVDE